MIIFFICETIEKIRYPPSRGIIFTFPQSNLNKVNKCLSQLSTIFSNEIKEEYHHPLIPQETHTLPLSPFNPTKEKPATYASQVVQKM